MYARNLGFLLRNLIVRDFKIRYRNMSLGVFWSLLNPIVMMSVLWFVFTKIFQGPSENFHLAVLSGIVIFNFFALSWLTATVSVHQNSGLIKRVPMPRELLPISTVLANVLHFAIQIGLLVVATFLSGIPANKYWFLLPVIFLLEIIFVCGLSLVTSALDVYFRDMQYIVESANTLLFWLVPIIYSFSMIPQEYRSIYQYNPIAAVVLATRAIVLENRMPPSALMYKLVLVSFGFLVVGFFVFRRLKRNFADCL